MREKKNFIYIKKLMKFFWRCMLLVWGNGDMQIGLIKFIRYDKYYIY